MVTDRVKAYLSQCELRRARLPIVASALCMSPATLDRKLRAEGSTWLALLDAERKARFDKAKQAMDRKAYGREIIRDLGYCEVNSFYRAFRRWYGAGYRTARVGADVAH